MPLKAACKPKRACGYGIITSRREPKPCKASLWTPERTFYHNLGLSPLRLRRSLHFAQLNCGIINATATVFIENRWPHNCGQLKCKHFSVAFLLSSSGSAGAELRRMNPPTNSCGICGCGIISSQANSKAVCKAPKRRFCPAGAGNVRTLYHKFQKAKPFVRQTLLSWTASTEFMV